MEIVVVSDSHGKNEVFSKLRELHPHADAYISCGDTECDPSFLDGFVSVLGNNDRNYDYPKRLILEIKGLRILVQHGDRIPPMILEERLFEYARAEACNLMCFGHTHMFYKNVRDGITLLNPGSIYYNRDGSTPSYALVSFENNQIKVERKTLAESEVKKNRFFSHF